MSRVELYRRVAPIRGSREVIGSDLEISPVGLDELGQTGFLKGEIRRRNQKEKEFVPLYVSVAERQHSSLTPYQGGRVARGSECDSYLLALDHSDLVRLKETGEVLVKDHCLIKLSKNGQ